MSQSAHPEANIIFGATIDDALGDEVRVTVIAAGFDGGMPKRRETESGFRRTPQQQQSQEQTRAAAQALAAKKSEQAKEPEHATVGAGARQQTPTPKPQFGDDDLDIPDFLK